MKIAPVFVSLLLISCNQESSTTDAAANDQAKSAGSFHKIDKNYLTCKISPGIFNQCQLVSDKIVIKPSREVGLRYDIQYKSGCQSMRFRPNSRIYLTQGSQEKQINYDEKTWQELGSFEGQEPITIVDKIPHETFYHDFMTDSPCFIEFRYKAALNSASKKEIDVLVNAIKQGSIILNSANDQALIFSMLERDITALDIHRTKNLFSDFKDYLEDYYSDFLSDEEKKEIMLSIDEIMALNMSVNPDSEIQTAIEQGANKLSSLSMKLSESISNQLAIQIARVEKLLSFADEDQSEGIKAEIEKIKYDLSK